MQAQWQPIPYPHAYLSQDQWLQSQWTFQQQQNVARPDPPYPSVNAAPGPVSTSNIGTREDHPTAPVDERHPQCAPRPGELLTRSYPGPMQHLPPTQDQLRCSLSGPAPSRPVAVQAFADAANSIIADLTTQTAGVDLEVPEAAEVAVGDVLDGSESSGVRTTTRGRGRGRGGGRAGGKKATKVLHIVPFLGPLTSDYTESSSLLMQGYKRKGCPTCT